MIIYEYLKLLLDPVPTGQSQLLPGPAVAQADPDIRTQSSYHHV
jgi:hypothetical protein